MSIISRTEKPATGAFKYYNGKLTDLISKLKNEPEKNIYCDGGSEIVNELFAHNLIDEMIISIVFVSLNDGVILFKSRVSQSRLVMLSCSQFEKGLVQLHYKLENN